MANTGNDALIISDGGLASLVAVWREAISRRARAKAGRTPDIRSELRAVIRGEPEAGPVVFSIADPDSLCASAAARQAELAGFTLLSPGSASDCDSVGSEGLLRAARIAAERGLSRIIWPIQIGHAGAGSMERLTTAADRAAQVAQLAALDLPRAGGPTTLSIETPLLDLNDAVLLELALDLDGPVPRPLSDQPGFDAAAGACWWCELGQTASGLGAAAGGQSMCGACNGCTRWREAWRNADPSGLLTISEQ